MYFSELRIFNSQFLKKKNLKKTYLSLYRDHIYNIQCKKGDKKFMRKKITTTIKKKYFVKSRKLVDTHKHTPTLIQSVILILFLNLAGTTVVAANVAASSAVAGGKDRRQLNGQSVRQHPYPRT